MKIRSAAQVSILIGFFSIAWFSCNKTDNTPPIPKPNPLEEKVTASVSGRVVDEAGKPVGNASLHAGNSTTTTDVNGTFRFTNIQLSKNAGFVSVEKNGYFKTGRTIFTNTGVVNNIEIKLIPKIEKGSFQVTAGGNINIATGTTVVFPANGIINKATNAAYSGNVKVFGTYLNPEDPNLSLIMPGNLTGLTKENEQKILQTYGMIGVELEGSNGEKLNLASGKTATITLSIPPSLQASAPATIPLWYFSDSLGIWKEEGSATKQGNAYTGTVSHFSFWNCDVPELFRFIKLTLKNQNQELLAGYRVVLKNTQNNSLAYSITDSTGVVTGAVPINAAIEMKVYNLCNAEIHTQTIGPFSSHADLGIITVNTPANGNIIVSGTVLNCSQTPVSNGFVEIQIENGIYRAPISNGSYSIAISRCNMTSASLKISATDLVANQQSNSTSINVTSGNYNIDIAACGNSIDQYIYFTDGSTIISFSAPPDTLIGGYWYSVANNNNIKETEISAQHNMQDSLNAEYFSLKFLSDASPGSYTVPAFNYMIIFKGNPTRKVFQFVNPFTVHITEFGGPGGFIAGNFATILKEEKSNTIVSTTCNFRVRRLL